MGRKFILFFSYLSLAVSIGLSEGSLAARTIAGTVAGYVPPPPRGNRRQSTVAGGSRGCAAAGDVSLTLLVPSDHVATTTLSHPVFLFHLDAIFPRPLIFTLVEPGIAEPLFQKKFILDRSGIVRIELPANGKGLEEGKEYYWTVTLSCNERRPSENAYARAAIERVPVPSQLKRELDSKPDRLTRAEIYARSGIWYDALALSYRADLPAPDRYGETAYFRQLLKRVGLDKILLEDDLAN